MGSGQQMAVPAVTQAQAIAIPVQGERDLSRSRRSSQEQPSSWTRAGMPAPASPFATAEDDDDFTFSGSRATEGDPARLELPGFSSASTQPGTSPGQDSLFALRQQASSASQQAQQDQRRSSRMADGALGRARRSLESADSAYTAMHAERQHQVEQLALRGGAAPAARPEAASDAGRSAVHDQSQHQASCDGRSDLTPGYSQASSMALSPVVGRPVRYSTFILHASLKVLDGCRDARQSRSLQSSKQTYCLHATRSYPPGCLCSHCCHTPILQSEQPAPDLQHHACSPSPSPARSCKVRLSVMKRMRRLPPGRRQRCTCQGLGSSIGIPREAACSPWRRLRCRLDCRPCLTAFLPCPRCLLKRSAPQLGLPASGYTFQHP